MSSFPFKTLTCYQVIVTFTSPRSNDVFTVGDKVTYISSSLNHYEGIEICIFKNILTGTQLVWHADEISLANSEMFLQPVAWK
jgi:hypothetical protein